MDCRVESTLATSPHRSDHSLDKNSDTPDPPSSENASDDSGEVDMEYVDAQEPGKQRDSDKCNLPENLLSVLPFFSSSSHFGLNDDKPQPVTDPRPAPTSSNGPPRNTVFQIQSMKTATGNAPPPNVPLSKDLFSLMTIDTGINFASICTSIGAPSESTKRDRHAVELTNQINKLKTELNNYKDDLIKKDKSVKQLTLEQRALEVQLKEERLISTRLKNLYTESIQSMQLNIKKEHNEGKFLKRHYKMVRDENLRLMAMNKNLQRENAEILKKLTKEIHFKGYHQFESVDLHNSDPGVHQDHNEEREFELNAQVSSPALKELENPERDSADEEINIFNERADRPQSVLNSFRDICCCNS